MKLCVLFTGLVSQKHLSGGDQLFLDLAPRLPKQIELVVITPQLAKKHWKSVKRKSIKFNYLKKNIFDNHNNTLFVFLSYTIRSWQTYQILRKEKQLDAIYSCSDVAYADIWPAFLICLGKPEINWITRIYHVLLNPKKRHGNRLINFVAFYLQRFSFFLIKKRSNHILALNSKLKKELLGLNFPENRTGILGAGVEFAKINKFKTTKKFNFEAVVLARIAPAKGIYDMVKIWKLVHEKNPGWKMAWIGSGGGYELELKSKIKENGLENSFYLLGYLKKEKILNIFKSSKLFLCTDHESGWSLATSEAMAAGLPVVSFNIDIFGGLYKKGFISVPLHDTQKFAKETIKLLENENLRIKLAKEAILQSSAFSLDEVAKTLVSYLKLS